MDLKRQEEKLRLRQIALNEGLHLMKLNRAELTRNIDSANKWGAIAIISDVILIPLNIIVNSISPTNPAYLIKDAFDYYDKLKSLSNGEINLSRADTVSLAIDKLEDYLKRELTKRGATSHIPGVRILAGLSKDAVGLIDKVVSIQEGGRELPQLLKMFDRNLEETIRKIEQAGIERALVHDLIDKQNRTG